VSLGLAAKVFERNVYTYRRQWTAFLTGFFEPVFYLLSLGLGLGALVGAVRTDSGASVSYAQFVAPAMLATSAMNGAIFDATYNMFFKLKYARTFEAMLATPIGRRAIAEGVGTGA
jgi:lipooligosaccharide transport system permease protein